MYVLPGLEYETTIRPSDDMKTKIEPGPPSLVLSHALFYYTCLLIFLKNEDEDFVYISKKK